MQLAIDRDIAVQQEWIRGHKAQHEIDQACIGDSGAVATRRMTAEERRRYGGPDMVVCRTCGRLKPQTREHFDTNKDGFSVNCRVCVAACKSTQKEASGQ